MNERRTRRTMTARRVGIPVAVALLVIASAVAARPAYRLARTYRQFNAVVKRLPDLPALTLATRPRSTAFPVVWIHRVDSVERAALMARAYDGMEIDVAYDARADDFDVGHRGVPSRGISLQAVLAAVPRVRQHYFWIDFQNLSEANKDAACSRLLSIARTFGIVDRTIVESSNPAALSCFTENGFYTSYYLFAESSLPAMSREQLADYYAEVRTNLAASRVNAVSSSYRSLPFIEKYLPDSDVLLWYLEPRGGLGSYAWLGYLRTRSRVKVILVHQPSAGYR